MSGVLSRDLPQIIAGCVYAPGLFVAARIAYGLNTSREHQTADPADWDLKELTGAVFVGVCWPLVTAVWCIGALVAWHPRKERDDAHS